MRLNWDKKSWENCLFPWIYLSWKNIVAMTTVQKSKFVYISVKNFPLVNFSRWIPILSKLRPNKLPPEKLPPRPNPTWKILTQKVLSKFKNKPARFKCVDLDIGYRVLTLPIHLQQKWPGVSSKGVKNIAQNLVFLKSKA